MKKIIVVMLSLMSVGIGGLKLCAMVTQSWAISSGMVGVSEEQFEDEVRSVLSAIYKEKLNKAQKMNDLIKRMAACTSKNQVPLVGLKDCEKRGGVVLIGYELSSWQQSISNELIAYEAFALPYQMFVIKNERLMNVTLNPFITPLNMFINRTFENFKELIETLRADWVQTGPWKMSDHDSYYFFKRSKGLFNDLGSLMQRLVLRFGFEGDRVKEVKRYRNTIYIKDDSVKIGGDYVTHIDLLVRTDQWQEFQNIFKLNISPLYDI